MKHTLLKPCVYACLGCALSTTSSAATSPAEGEWQFKLAPFYLWAFNMDSDASVGSNTVDLDLNFVEDVAENLTEVYTFYFEARKEEFSYFLDYQYFTVEPWIHAGPRKTDVELSITMIDLGLGYALSDDGTTRWEAITGIRYNKHDLDLEGRGALGITASTAEDWMHGFVGARVEHQIDPEWTFSARGDIGYATRRNNTFNANAVFDYRFNDWGSVFMGYQYRKFDYDSGGSGKSRYAYDGVQYGPLLGVNIHW